MTITVRAIVAAALTLPLGMAFGQVKADEPIKTTLCELVEAPKRYNGKMVQVRATMKSGFEWGGLVDGSCSLLLSGDGFPPISRGTGEYAYLKSFADIDHPEKLAWKPIQLPPKVRMVEDVSYQEFKRYLLQKWKRIDGSECFDCPLYEITVTVTGRFDHLEEKMVAVRSNREEHPRMYSAGFGHLNASANRLVWQSVSEVVAKQIDWAVYEKRK